MVEPIAPARLEGLLLSAITSADDILLATKLGVRPESFVVEAHERAWNWMSERVLSGQPLPSLVDLHELGVEVVEGASDVEGWAQRLADEVLSTKINKTLVTIARERRLEVEPRQALSDLVNQLTALNVGAGRSNNITYIDHDAGELLAEVRSRAEFKALNRPLGIPTGLSFFDNDGWSWQPGEVVAILGSLGVGKALAVDTPIPTPTGWTTMGGIEVGDQVFDEDGNVTNVIAVSDVLIDRPCYRVCFSDGSSLVADANHLWLTSSLRERKAKTHRTEEYREKRRQSRVLTRPGSNPSVAARNKERAFLNVNGSVRRTAEIAESIMAGNQLNHSVRVAKPLSLPEQDLSIDPYTLGVWLGDGTSADGSITTADMEIMDQLRSLGHTLTKRSNKYGWGVKGLRLKLRELGLLHNKNIPQQYARASFSQRLRLLQGLVDTDGHVRSDGRVEITLCNKKLMDGLMDLLWGLGIKASVGESRATLNGRDCGPRWRTSFITYLPVARLSRKARLQKTSGFKGIHDQRYITSITSVPSAPVRCIQVSSESSLYLAGRSMVPTHNSSLLSSLCCAAYQAGSKILYLSPETTRKEVALRTHVFLARFDKEREWRFKRSDLHRGTADLDEYKEWTERMARRKDWAVIDSGAKGSFNLDEIMQLTREHRPGVLAIDGFHLIINDGRKQAWEELREAAIRLKGLAQDTGTVIFAVCQTVRDALAWDDKVPESHQAAYGAKALLEAADRVLALAKHGNDKQMRKLGVLKFRDGPDSKGVDILLEFKADEGVFRQIL